MTLTIKSNAYTPDNMDTLWGADWRDLTFWEWFGWRLKSSGMWCCVTGWVVLFILWCCVTGWVVLFILWCCVTGWVVLFISANYSAWNFRVSQCDCMEHWALLTLHPSITSEKAWIFRSRFVEYGSEIYWAYLLISSCLFCHGTRCLLVCAHDTLIWLTADVYWYVHMIH